MKSSSDNGKSLFLTKKLFVIPEDQGTYILFAPPKGSVMRVNGGVVALLQEIKRTGKISQKNDSKSILSALQEKELVMFGEETLPKARNLTLPFKSTSVTIFQSTDCNLRCTYCYSKGGWSPTDIKPEVALGAVDFIVHSALQTPIPEKGKRRIRVGFHGGGEPLLPRTLPLVKEVLSYARSLASEHDLELRTSVSTNGLLSKKNLSWAMNNFDRIQVSLDGPEDIQNSQRPAKNNSPSFPSVLRTVEELERSGKEYNIRATISEYGVMRMTEIFEFFSKISSTSSFHFEPLYECGRCQTVTGPNDVLAKSAPAPHVFLAEFIKTQEVARSQGKNIYCSGGRVDSLLDTYCGALGRNFVVTPEGDVTTCFEVCRQSDPRSKDFFIGKFEKDGFVFFDEKIERLAYRNVDNLEYCKDCFLQYSCAGDCPAKSALEFGDFMKAGGPRCEVNHTIGINNLQELLEGGVKNG